jgi:reverse gyrase
MRERGLGYPLTYAARIVKTLLEHGYIVEGKDFLLSATHGQKILAYHTTRFPHWISESSSGGSRPRWTLWRRDGSIVGKRYVNLAL